MQPGADNAVLCDSSLSPMGAMVLSGLEGVKQRFGSAIVSQRIAALLEAHKYSPIRARFADSSLARRKQVLYV